MGRQAANEPRLFLVDQTMRDLVGHHFEYNMELARAASALGLASRIFANVLFEPPEDEELPAPIDPVFTVAWHDARRPHPIQHGDFLARPSAYTFGAELFQALDRHGASPEDHVLLHSIGFSELEEVQHAVLTRAPSALPMIHILFRRDLDELARPSPAFDALRHAAISLWQAARVTGRLRFYTDTPELSAHYAAHLSVPVETLPLPIAHHRMAENAPRRPGAPLKITYLGDARTEKGFHHLANAIGRLAADANCADKVEFVLQSNFNVKGGEPLVVGALRNLERHPEPFVTLLREPLGSSEYFERLSEADIIVAPYDPRAYERRSSSVFVEALCAGKVVIVPRGSSMEAWLPRDQGVVWNAASPLADTIRDAVDRFPSLSAAAAKRRPEWAAQHTAAKLIAGLLTDTAPTPAPPHVLVIVDGESLYYRIGSAYVMRAQLESLAAAGYLVSVAFLVHKQLSAQDLESIGGVAHWTRQCRRLLGDLPVLGAFVCYYRDPPPATSSSLEEDWLSRKSLLIPEAMRRFLTQYEPDCVICNYVQNALAVPLLGLTHLPSAIWTHDIQSYQYAYRRRAPIDPDELAFELARYKQFQTVVSINTDETERFQALGLQQVVTIAPEPALEPLTQTLLAGCQDLAEVFMSSGPRDKFVHFDQAWESGQTDQLLRLFNERSLDVLFVGSYHTPNMQALDWYVEQVHRPLLAPRGINLTVAGGVSSERGRLKDSSIFWTGIVEDLRPLYAAAKVIVIPVQDGAGINIKVLEATALGKPIVATSVALRGLPGVRDYISGIDDPAEFGRAVSDLVQSPLRRRAASKLSSEAYAAFSAGNDAVGGFNEVMAKLLGNRARTIPPPTERAPTTFVEYDETDRVLGRFLRSMLTSGDSFDADKTRFESELAANPEKMAEILLNAMDALAVSGSAPLLSWERISKEWRVVGGDTPFEAMAKLYARATLQRRPPPDPALALAGLTDLREIYGADTETGLQLFETDDEDDALYFSYAQAPREIDLTALADTGLVVPLGVDDALEDAVSDLLARDLHDPDVRKNMTFVAPYTSTAQRPAYSGRVVVGELNSNAALAAALGVILPCSGARTFSFEQTAFAIQALALGKPVIAAEGALWFLKAEDRTALETPREMMRAQALDLLESPSARERAARRAAAAFAAFNEEVGHNIPTYPEFQWTLAMGALARIAVALAARKPPGEEDVLTLADAFHDAEERPKIERVYDAMFLSKTSPWLASLQLAHTPALRSAGVSLDSFLATAQRTSHMRAADLSLHDEN